MSDQAHPKTYANAAITSAKPERRFWGNSVLASRLADTRHLNAQSQSDQHHATMPTRQRSRNPFLNEYACNREIVDDVVRYALEDTLAAPNTETSPEVVNVLSNSDHLCLDDTSSSRLKHPAAPSPKDASPSSKRVGSTQKERTMSYQSVDASPECAPQSLQFAFHMPPGISGGTFTSLSGLADQALPSPSDREKQRTPARSFKPDDLYLNQKPEFTNSCDTHAAASARHAAVRLPHNDERTSEHTAMYYRPQSQTMERVLDPSNKPRPFNLGMTQSERRHFLRPFEPASRRKGSSTVIPKLLENGEALIDAPSELIGAGAMLMGIDQHGSESLATRGVDEHLDYDLDPLKETVGQLKAQCQLLRFKRDRMASTGDSLSNTSKLEDTGRPLMLLPRVSGAVEDPDDDMDALKGDVERLKAQRELLRFRQDQVEARGDWVPKTSDAQDTKRPLLFRPAPPSDTITLETWFGPFEISRSTKLNPYLSPPYGKDESGEQDSMFDSQEGSTMTASKDGSGLQEADLEVDSSLHSVAALPLEARGKDYDFAIAPLHILTGRAESVGSMTKNGDGHSRRGHDRFRATLTPTETPSPASTPSLPRSRSAVFPGEDDFELESDAGSHRKRGGRKPRRRKA